MADHADVLGQVLAADAARPANSNQVASLFEFALVAPNGEQITCPVAEWATVVAGRIKEFHGYYDPRAFVTAFGLGS